MEPSKVPLLLARLAVAAVFLSAVIGKLGNPAGFIGSLEQGGVPLAPVAGWIGMAIELIGPLLLVVGWRAHWGAWALLAFTLAASVIGHPFWSLPEPDAAMQQMQFFKNLAIAGGLWALALHGNRGTILDLVGASSGKHAEAATTEA